MHCYSSVYSWRQGRLCSTLYGSPAACLIKGLLVCFFSQIWRACRRLGSLRMKISVASWFAAKFEVMCKGHMCLFALTLCRWFVKFHRPQGALNKQSWIHWMQLVEQCRDAKTLTLIFFSNFGQKSCRVSSNWPPLNPCLHCNLLSDEPCIWWLPVHDTS